MSSSVSGPGGRSRARGLSIKTNLPPSHVSMFKAKDEQVMSAPAHKTEFSIAEAPTKRAGVSEALLNDNWRQNRRPHGDFMETPMTAPPRKVKFTEDETIIVEPTMEPEIEPMMEKKKMKKQLRVNTALANIGGPRRYRDSRDSPLDSEFILSAPATKQEFSVAHDEEQWPVELSRPASRVDHKSTSHVESLQDDISAEHEEYFRNSGNPNKLFLGPKQTLHIDAFTPAFLPDGSSQDVPLSASSVWTVGPSTIAAVTPTDPSEASYLQVYPHAEMRPVLNGGNTLRPMPWASMGEEFKSKLAQLEADYSALSSSSMAKFLRHEKGRQNVAREGVLNDPAIQSMQVGGQNRHGSSPHKQEKEGEKKDFSALLAKLNKSSAGRLQTDDPAIIDLKPSNKLRHASQDSGIGGVVDETSPQKASTLNPKASEFCSVSQKKQPATIGNEVPAKFNRPSIMGYFDGIISNGAGFSSKDIQNIHDLQAVMERMQLLESQIQELQTAQKGQLQQPPAQPPLGQGYLAGGGPVNMPVGVNGQLGMDGRMSSGPIVGQNEINAHLLASRAIYPQPSPQSSSSPSYPMVNNMPGGFPAPGAAQNGISVSSTAPPAYSASNLPPFNLQPAGGPHHNSNAGPPMMVPPAFAVNAGHRVQSMPPAGLTFQNTQQQQPPAIQRAASGPLPSGPLAPGATLAPAFIQNAFGPKPVRKPRGPFRPGDPVQAKQQQEYEAYLEWRRSNDLNYAKQCKARQNRRAERIQEEQRMMEASGSQVSSATNNKENVKA